MGKSHNTNRKHRRKVGQAGTDKGLQEHRKREKRRKRNVWRQKQLVKTPE